jgi:hypothetical protein
MRIEISRLVLGNGPHFLDCPARSLVTIPTTLRWIRDFNTEETKKRENFAIHRLKLYITGNKTNKYK